jgi:hypothetical protein
MDKTQNMPVKIYALVCPNSANIRYIGITKRSLNVRLSEHMKERHVNKRCSWIRSLKNNNLKPEIILLDEVNSDYDFWEQHYISLFSSFGFNLVNGTLGGMYKSNMTLEVKKKLSESKKKYKFTDEHLSNMREASKRRRGINLSADHVKKVVQKLRGRKHSHETKLKMSIAQSGRKFTEEQKKKCSKSSKSKKPILQIDMNGKVVKKWDSLRQAQIKGGFHRGHIISCIIGEYNQHGGYKWMYA